MHLSLAEVNRKVAIARWRNRDAKINSHLGKVRTIPQYATYKARLLGFLTGDGSISIHSERGRKDNCHHTIGFFPDHQSLIPPYQEAFQALYMVTPKVKDLGRYYSLRVSCRPAALDLLTHGKLNSTEWRVPLGLLTTDELKAEWLRAYFDCDGYVGKRIIQVQSVSEQGLRMVQHILTRWGIKSGFCTYHRKQSTWNINYILSICGHESRELFLHKVGFNHAEKLRRLEETLKNAKRFKEKKTP